MWKVKPRASSLRGEKQIKLVAGSRSQKINKNQKDKASQKALNRPKRRAVSLSGILASWAWRPCVRVDRGWRHAAGEGGDHMLGRRQGGAAQCILRGAAEMRGEDDIVAGAERPLRRAGGIDIQRRAAQMAALQGGGQCRFVDQPGAGEIDQQRARLHRGEGGFIHQPLGLRAQRRVQRDQIRPGEAGGQAGGALMPVVFCDARGEDQQMQAECRQHGAELSPGMAPADDQGGLAAQLGEEAAFAKPGLAGAQGGIRRRDAACQRQGQPQRQLRHRTGIGSRRGGDDDIARLRRGLVHRVMPGPVHDDGAQRIRRREAGRIQPGIAGDHVSAVSACEFRLGL